MFNYIRRGLSPSTPRKITLSFPGLELAVKSRFENEPAIKMSIP